MTFAASGAAPTPLYHQYQEAFGLTPFMLTVVFGAYVLSLLGALLTVGSLSDYIGRRPAIKAALALNIAAMVMFIAADSAGALIAARAVQGYATGLATATLGATILDTDRIRGPVLNSVTAFAGLTAGNAGLHVRRVNEIRALRELKRATESPFVFVSERGAPFATSGFAKMVARVGVEARFKFRVHPHMLRHACGYALANKGHDTLALQAYLGHKNIQHTVRYTELSPARFNFFWRD
jgi:hypothetical protein